MIQKSNLGDKEKRLKLHRIEQQVVEITKNPQTVVWGEGQGSLAHNTSVITKSSALGGGTWDSGKIYFIFHLLGQNETQITQIHHENDPNFTCEWQPQIEVSDLLQIKSDRLQGETGL